MDEPKIVERKTLLRTNLGNCWNHYVEFVCFATQAREEEVLKYARTHGNAGVPWVRLVHGRGECGYSWLIGYEVDSSG